jgi:hypothetical protein
MLRKNNKDPLKIQLYNLEEDISETTDLAEQHPELVKEMAAMMAKQHTPSELFPIPPID